MNTLLDRQSAWVAACHVAALLGASIILVSEPELAPMVATLVGAGLAISISGSVGLGLLYAAAHERTGQPDPRIGNLIATYLGGSLCYGVVLGEAVSQAF